MQLLTGIEQHLSLAGPRQGRDAASRRVAEAVASLRDKDVRSTTLERVQLMREIDAQVQGLPQPLQFGEGLAALLDRIETPLSPDDLLLGRIAEQVPDEGEEAFFQETIAAWNRRGIPPWMHDGGHECFAWDRMLRLGLPGLEAIAQGELARRTAAGAAQAQIDFLRGAMLVYQAFRRYARRYAAAAYAAGMLEPAAWCAAIAERPPATFAEALQLMWLVGHVFCTMLSVNPTLTFGRMDELLLPYYLQDLEEGLLTRAEAGDLVEDFYCKNNLVLGRGEHQMSLGTAHDTGWQRNLTYDAPQYVVLGGRRPEGGEAVNDLTLLFLERIVPRFENPVIVLRYTPDLPEAAWRLACEKMRANASMLVYNDEQVIPAMVHCGIEPHDAVTYTMHGCNWPDIPGVQHALEIQFLILPRLVRDVLLDPELEIASLDDVYAHLATRVGVEVGALCDGLRTARAAWDAQAPGVLRVADCFFEGPVAEARSWQLGGIRYPNVICSIAGTGTAADSLAALEAVAFGREPVPLDALRDALRDDFAGQEALRRRCLNAPHYGQDDGRADRHAVRLLEMVHREIDRASRLGTPGELIVFRCLETDMRHIPMGAEIGATPDGRRAGQPLSENTSPAPGSGIHGLTAMLRSVAKLPMGRASSGALNVRLQPAMFAGEEGLARLAHLLRAYFDVGGLQVQLSLADVAELRDAQVHPEQHRDLMVRITGYSAAFVDMQRSAQDEIIRREEMGS